MPKLVIVMPKLASQSKPVKPSFVCQPPFIHR